MDISLEISKIIQEIQYMLAPAIMVSSSALLLLGFQTKFSNLAHRFRLLNQETQHLSQKTTRSNEEEIRLSNLMVQVQYLFRRATLVKNAILLTYTGILFLACASILILLQLYSLWRLHHAIIACFSMGLFALFCTAIIMILETNLFYRIMIFEKKSRLL